jgi:ATP-dependent protease ClpP protease subunit
MRDNWMFAEEALKYGIVDEVAGETNNKETTKK